MNSKKFLLLIIKIKNIHEFNVLIFTQLPLIEILYHAFTLVHELPPTCINVMNFAFELTSLLKWRIIHLLGVFLWVVSMWVLLQFYNLFIKFKNHYLLLHHNWRLYLHELLFIFNIYYVTIFKTIVIQMHRNLYWDFIFFTKHSMLD
jgi:hypothetical protein